MLAFALASCGGGGGGGGGASTAPSISSASYQPSSPYKGGKLKSGMNITGSNFASPATVKLGDTACDKSGTLASSTSITGVDCSNVTLPNAATVVLQVTSNGQTATYPISLSERYSLVAKAGGGTYDKTECVKDNVTGLIWEVQTAGSTDTRSVGKGYSNYDSSATGNRQKSSDEDATSDDVNATTNSVGYVNTVNGLRLCGYSDWRMPTRDELWTLIDTSSNPNINSTWFPNTAPENYWTSTPGTYSNAATYVNFETGITNQSGRFINWKVRLVRASQ